MQVVKSASCCTDGKYLDNASLAQIIKIGSAIAREEERIVRLSIYKVADRKSWGS